jgi:hypothetical protein
VGVGGEVAIREWWERGGCVRWRKGIGWGEVEGGLGRIELGRRRFGETGLDRILSGGGRLGFRAWRAAS